MKVVRLLMHGIMMLFMKLIMETVMIKYRIEIIEWMIEIIPKIVEIENTIGVKSERAEFFSCPFFLRSIFMSLKTCKQINFYKWIYITTVCTRKWFYFYLLSSKFLKKS